MDNVKYYLICALVLRVERINFAKQRVISPMPILLTLGDVVQSSFQNLWLGFAGFFPRLLGAVVVFIIGSLVAMALKGLVMKISDVLHLDTLSEKIELKGSLAKLGITLKINALLGWLVKWFVVVASLLAATDILDWTQISDFLKQVVFYIPNVFIAVVIFLAGIVLADFTRRVVHHAVEAAGLASADFVAGISKWAILIFTLMAALVQLQVADALIRTLFTGLVGMLALAGGLAFGLGGKEQAARFLERLRKDISEHHK